MSKASAAVEDWTGLIFANGWVIDKKLSCAEYRKIYLEQTGDATKIIKNAHYLCRNEHCGISTYIERTVIQRALRNGTACLSKCKGCSGKKENCHYSIQCREKNLTKIPDRSEKIKIGDIYGFWKVIDIITSEDNSDHQCRAKCKCILCEEIKLIRYDTLINLEAACECYKKHSTGEMLVKKYLDKYGIDYKTEYVFDNLIGLGGGQLRYDFAIFNGDNLISLIEFDGEQHFEEAGSYFNPTGKVQIHDGIKNDFAKNNNIFLLRIPYTDIGNIENILFKFLF